MNKIFCSLIMVLFFSVNCLKTQKSGLDLSSPGGFLLFSGFQLLLAGQNFTLSGTISGFTEGIMILKNNSEELTLQPSDSFSFKNIAKDSSYKITVSSNPSGSICSVANGEGKMTADVTNAAIICISAGTPQAVYSPSDWNDYVKNNGTDRFSADGTACTGSETGGYYKACVHSGEIRKFDFFEKTSCEGLTGSDDAVTGGALNWICSAGKSKITFYSTGLKKGKYLSDLLDWTTSIPVWKSISFSVSEGKNTLLKTKASVWWKNSISSDSLQSGPFNTAGMIYPFTQAMQTTQNSLDIGANKTSYVVKPEFILSQSNGAKNSVLALMKASAAKSFIWIEGSFDASEYCGGIVANGSFYVLKNVKIQNPYQSTASCTTVTEAHGISIPASNSLIEDAVSINSAQNGIHTSGSYNLFLDVLASNNTTNGIQAVSPGTNNSFFRILAASNASRGFLIQGQTLSAVQNITSINNNATGEDLLTGSNQHLLINSLLLNNATSGFSQTGTSNNTVYDIFSSNNGASAAAAQINSTSGSYTNNTYYGTLRFSGTSVSACGALATPAGIGYTNVCAVEGNSNFSTSFNIDTISSILGESSGKAGSDSSNSDFSTGQAPYSLSINMLNFQNKFRAVGKSGGIFPDLTAAQRGNCTAGTCQLWDLSLKKTDVTARNINSCPDGNSVISYNSNTVLKNAVEILNDGIGDEDGLCESNETCLYIPNSGAYQGHGNLISASSTSPGTTNCSDISSGTVSNIKLMKYESNGY